MRHPSVARWFVVVRHAAAVGALYAATFSLFFLPALAKGKLLAPGDGLVQNLPLFLLQPTLWTSMVFGGYPLFADPQNLSGAFPR